MDDHYFLSVLAVLAEKPERIKRLFISEQTNIQGVFGVMLTKNGARKEVIVDDFIPCLNQAPVFGRSDGKDVWVMLIEKAWAKVHGSYDRIIGGNCHMTLRDLTGAPSYEFESRDDDTWFRIREAVDRGYITMAGAAFDDLEERKKLKRLGISVDYTYGIIDVHEVDGKDGARHKLVKLRNPWCSFRWKGNWSHESASWTQEAKEQVRLNPGMDHDSFWMAYEEFKFYFSRITLCKYVDSYAFSYSNIKINPNGYHLVKLNVRQGQTSFTIATSQKDERCMPRNSGYQYKNVKMIVVRSFRNKDGLEMIEYMGGCKTFQERDSYIELKNSP